MYVIILLQSTGFKAEVINQVIIDSVGITGLQEVKKKAWEKQ